MRYLPTMAVALQGILANKLRALLTVLGVIIGIGSIISMMAVGEGSEKTVTSQFTQLGSNLLYVQPGAGWMGMLRGAEGTAKTLTYDDAMAIAESPDMDSVKYVIPESVIRTQLIAGEENINATVSGVTPEFESARNKTMASGSFFTEYDIENKSMVCVLGSGVAEDLFGETDPVGEKVRFNVRSFTVAGVMESDDESIFLTSDNTVFIPITTQMYRINPKYSTGGDQLVDGITIQAVSEKEIDSAIRQVSELLRERHQLAANEEDDFTITNQQEYIDMQTETSDTFKTLLSYTAFMALLIAGIGIMNIMLVSVTERTREIGIRKAVGAKRRHILVQFLLEAASISLLGGVIGIGAGYAASEYLFAGFEMNQVTMTQSTIDPIVTLDIVLLSFAVAVGVGIVFGIYPAIRASRLNPIEALRYE